MIFLHFATSLMSSLPEEKSTEIAMQGEVTVSVELESKLSVCGEAKVSPELR